MNKHIKAGIIGGAGYTGGELIRILLQHPQVEIAFVHSKSQAGKALAATHTDLLGDTDMLFTGELDYNVDVLFLCVGHGEAKVFLEAHPVPDHVKVIDLSQDFRLSAESADPRFVYGLPELQRAAIAKAQRIANPGCFATALQLGMLPLAAAGKLQTVYATGITGSTGAGQSLSASSHFSWRANNIQAYKTLNHQHMAEVKQSLQQAGAAEPEINFVPWRGDFTRGIFVSLQLTTTASLNELYALYNDYYKDHPFTHISTAPIHLKQVVNTNKCLIQLEQQGQQLAIHVVIDNLLKGASGQAVQNMNLMLGLEEDAGLRLKAAAF
jgi:N-acetyl-gamma-glutamyl-phosphate reductase